MPLIIISGYPSSGKTYRAKQLSEYLSSRLSNISSTKRLHHISDETLHISHTVYDLSSHSQHERSDNSAEKDARALMFAAVKKFLSDDDIVILDGLNYIKGWRYQLHCEAKAMRTGCCVLHVGTPIEQARKINEGRLSQRSSKAEGAGEERANEDEIKEEPYSKECWENLVFRYEEPNASARWDSPLFTVPWDDEQPPGAAIWDSVIFPDASKKIRPNAATVLKPIAKEDYLHELDKKTQEIIAKLLEWQKDHPGEEGGVVQVTELEVQLPGKVVNLPVLRRLQRQFIGLNRGTPIPAKRIRESFVDYLNGEFEKM